jgi:hypothetical protein
MPASPAPSASPAISNDLYNFAMLTRLALTDIQQILADTEVPPSVRLKAVLKQDWKLPSSTDFDTIPIQALLRQPGP